MGVGPHVALLAVAAALIGYFVVHERFVARSPLMPLALWRNRSVAGANIVSALVASALFAVFYSTTLYMQQVLGYSALRTGLAYVPFGLSILVAAVARAGPGGAGRDPLDDDRRGADVGRRVRAARPDPGRRPAADRRHRPDRRGRARRRADDRADLDRGHVRRGDGASHGVASALLNVSRQLGGALGLAVISAVVASAAAASAAAGHAPRSRSRPASGPGS